MDEGSREDGTLSIYVENGQDVFVEEEKMVRFLYAAVSQIDLLTRKPVCAIVPHDTLAL